MARMALTLAGLLVLGTAIAAGAQLPTTKPRPAPTDTPRLPGDKAPVTQGPRAPEGTSPAPPDPAALAAASAWVANFGYTVPPAQIPTMRDFRAMGGTIERAQALTVANSVHLRVMTGLESFELTHNADDGWIDNCSGMTRLRSFRMGPATNLTDRSAPFFARNPELRVLLIHGAKLTDAGFAHLRTLTKLEQLGLTRTQVGDASLPVIARNPNLRLLFLSYTRVTDAGLPHLYGLQKLERIDLQGRGTATGIAALKAHLPATTRIVHP